MATINLGSIKFKWQGAYAGGTAYTVDDVVSYNGSSYICILASTGNLPTNATYWEQMSQAGTDGTDLTSTLTTQGDILYRDGSGLQRLGAGTSGQFLQTGGTGANPSWGTVNSGLVQTVEQSYRQAWTQAFANGTSYIPLNDGSTDLQIQITPTSASNKILIWCMLGHFAPNQSSTAFGANAKFERKIGSGSYTGTFDISDQVNSSRPRGLFHTSQPGHGSYNTGFTFVSYDDSYNSTSQLTYRVVVQNHGSMTAAINYPPSHADSNFGYAASSVTRLIAQEIA